VPGRIDLVKLFQGASQETAHPAGVIKASGGEAGVAMFIVDAQSHKWGEHAGAAVACAHTRVSIQSAFAPDC
jgi:hypothetical protein